MSVIQAPAAGVKVPAGGRILATGLGFVEGPVAIDDEHIVVASINRGHLYRVPLTAGHPELLVETGGGPNCVTVGAHSDLWIAQNGGTVMPSKSAVPARPSIQHWSGDLETVYTGGLFGPSDCVVGPDGRLWFTDPADHALTGVAQPGCLRSLDPATGILRTELDDLQFPNGLAFGVEPGELYVAQTTAGVVRRYRVGPNGCRPDGWEFRMQQGKPDGLAVDAEGWLWVAGSTGDNLVAVDRAGAIRQQLQFGERVLVTSLCFAGPDLTTLVVTIAKGGTVLALPAPNPGLPLPVRRSR